MKNNIKNNIENTKKLKILLLTDRLTVGGAETHIASLYNSLTDLGHFVTVVSCGGELSKNIRHINIELASRSPLKLIRAYFALASLVKREGFDLLHAHARLPALIASFVARRFKIPLVTTVHAHFKLGFWRKKLSAWGFRSVAVSEDLRLYLSQSYSICAENITVIENGIDFEKYTKFCPCVCSSDKAFNLLFLSRLDFDCSLCAELLCHIAPHLAQKYGNIQITIGGGGECFSKIKSCADIANSRAGREIVRLEGAVCDVPDFLARGDAFVGVSRCAIEAVASSLPVIIAGNEGFLGRLTSENFSYALATNFCARGEVLPDEKLLFESICDLIDGYSLAGEDAKRICSEARDLLDVSLIAPRYEKFYLDVLKNYAYFKERTAKTLLFGYYGFSNLGDDALLRVAIKRARGEFGASVGALTNKPKKTAREFSIPCYSRSSPFSVFYRILRCQRLIFGGGTVFQDGTSKRSLLYYLFVLRLALLLKKDVLLYANGIGQIRKGWLRASLFKAFERCLYLGVRDERSFELLKSSLSDSSRVVAEGDLASYVPIAPLARSKYLIYNSLKKLKNSKDKCNSFFVVCPHFRASRFDRFELELAIRKQKNKGLTPLFVACSPYDAYLCRALNLKFGGGMMISRAVLSFSDLLSIFSFAKCVVSMRYHPLLAARMHSLPSVVIGTDSKIEEFKQNSGEVS